jgi:uncharacterized protein YjbJ (UPF0337 family)
MNQDQAKGKWDQLKGSAKKAWGKITNNDSKKVAGSVDKLKGAVRENVGDAEQAITEKFDTPHATTGKGSCCE